MKLRNIYTLPLVLFVFLPAGCAVSTHQLYYSAPSELSAVQRDMKTAGFWISQHPSPDKLIMNEEEIVEFNRHLREDLKLTENILDLTELSGPKLVEEWRQMIDEFGKKGFYLGDGRKADETFFAKINTQIMDTAVTLKIEPRFGFIIHYANQRIFPTSEGLYAKAGDIDFDELQNSALDVGTPVAVLSTSNDDQWCFVQSPLSAGWVRKEHVVWGHPEKVRVFFEEKNFVVVTRPKADIFLDRELTNYYDYARMGTKLMRHEVFYDKNIISIWLPQQGDDGKMTLVNAYMRLPDVHEGYLSYTPRNMINQAFELLNAPYGWGGMYGEQDCSAFLDEVFATAGIMLPRNSFEQRRSGQLLAEFTDGDTSEQEKLTALKKALGGITLLGMKGHILLYLGMVAERPYAIHAVWAYREPVNVQEDRIRVINRVAVSDLFLGEGSKNGSLLKRLREIVAVAK